MSSTIDSGAPESRTPAPPEPVMRRGLPPLGAALSLLTFSVAALSIPLTAASALHLSPAETTGWIMALYGGSGALSVGLVLRYRQPLLVTGNVFVLLFIVSLGNQFAWPELVGASVVAGAVVLVLGPLGLTERLAAWLPPPIVFGIVAAAVLPFFVDLFTELGDERLLVGTVCLTYLVGRRVLEPRVPALLPAVVVGLVVAGLTGGLEAPAHLAWPSPAVTAPVFSLRAMLTVTPVMAVLITLQANVPSIVYLHSQGYRVPQRAITVTSGVGTLLSSLLGPTATSLSLPATALCAGPEAGERTVRHWSALITGCGAVVIALLAGLAAQLTQVVPHSLLVAAVGLAVIGVLAGALQQVTHGPLLLGPMSAFAIALSDLSMLGLGPFFWALVLGPGVSVVLEHDAWRISRGGKGEVTEP